MMKTSNQFGGLEFFTLNTGKSVFTPRGECIQSFLTFARGIVGKSNAFVGKFLSEELFVSEQVTDSYATALATAKSPVSRGQKLPVAISFVAWSEEGAAVAWDKLNETKREVIEQLPLNSTLRSEFETSFTGDPKPPKSLPWVGVIQLPVAQQFPGLLPRLHLFQKALAWARIEKSA